jgi:hypothetical protein
MAEDNLIEFVNKSLTSDNWDPTIIGIFTLVAIVCNRHIIDEVWDKFGHIFDKPIAKVIILFCMMIWLLRNVRLSLLFCLLYIWFVSSIPEKLVYKEEQNKKENEHQFQQQFHLKT